MMNPLRTSLSQLRSRALRYLSKPSVTVRLYSVKEEPDYYQPGGFHRVHLGDTYNNGQYTILRKLGYGQYSTVWLARDSERQRYVALKILRADCYSGSGGSKNIFEREILLKISEVSRQSLHQGSKYVSHVLEQFTHSGPNGDHVCFAFDVLGHHLDFQTAKFEDGRLPVRAVRVIARQLLLALDFLHGEVGVVHTDLKPTNILLELENPNRTISQHLSNVPVRTDSQHEDATPLREVIPMPLVLEKRDIHIRIIDFGVASWRNRHLSELIQSPALRAPEVTIGAPWDTGVDIWSLGCIIVELVQGFVLFSGEASQKGTWTAEDDHLARITEVLGNLPLEFIRKGKRAGHFFDEKGNLRRIPYLKPTSLKCLLDGETKPFLRPADMPKTEFPVFIDFIRSMLEIDPASRKSAAELLRHEWVRL
ncbi:hypothetical protein BDV06DRAFT_234751 [Aspergillus oleicola]